jgi:hypothetical protein
VWREFAARGHLEFAVLPDGVNQDTRLGVSRDDGGTAAAALNQSCAIEERNIAVVQLVVVTGETALRQDGRDAGVEETRLVFGTILSARRHSESEDQETDHYRFIPTPN